MKAVFVLGLTVLAMVAHSQPFPVLEGKTEVLAVMPARLMFSGLPGDRAISPNGRYIGWIVGDMSVGDLFPSAKSFFIPDPNLKMPSCRLMVYDRELHTSEDRGSVGPGHMVNVSALGNGGTFLLTVMDQKMTPGDPVRIIISRSQDSSLTREMVLLHNEQLTVDPLGGYFGLFPMPQPSPRGKPNRIPVTVYNSQGQRVLTREVQGYPQMLNGLLALPSTRRGEPRQGLNLETGRVEPFALPETPERARVEWNEKPESSVPFQPAKLSARAPGATKITEITGGFQHLYIDPEDRFLVYCDGDAMLIRDIVPVDPKLWAQMKKEKERIQLVNRAKQVGLAVLIYSSDYDDVTPPSGNFDDRVMPYVKNREILRDFVFLLPGINQKSLDNPATTVLGFLQGDGGRAMVYADGHVKWVPN